MTAPGADPQARLAGTMVDVLVAELAEPGRLRRGRALAQQGAVVSLDVEPGLIVAAVQGSERDPYAVTARVATIAPPAAGGRLTELVPHRRQVRFECSCPDDDVPCKHAVATMTRFTQRMSYDPSLFLRWRTGADAPLAADDGVGGTGAPGRRPPGVPGAPSGPGGPGALGAGATTPEAPARLEAGAHAALRDLLGDPTAAPFIVPELPDLRGPTDVWDEVWRSMLADALATLRTGRLRPPAGSR